MGLRHESAQQEQPVIGPTPSRHPVGFPIRDPATLEYLFTNRERWLKNGAIALRLTQSLSETVAQPKSMTSETVAKSGRRSGRGGRGEGRVEWTKQRAVSSCIIRAPIIKGEDE